ncbi:hypothetical protein CYY_008028 [Polysphondylium violaceum]|uniref:Uncharacterized protein n=1 Tax=Polysphondylium violaceum TaxID=133409 RepID=A0A8J4UXA0_9MYCE|nr:hypothetical protein CYY_008028 [Polysphondylium violaceum]
MVASADLNISIEKTSHGTQQIPSHLFNINMEDFMLLSNSQISYLYRSIKGSKTTMVYAYDGTRRSWLINENNSQFGLPSKDKTVLIDYAEYSKTAIHNLLYQLVMMFQHGVDTIVYPMWFCTLENRGPEYLPKFIQYLWGLKALLDNPELIEMYNANGIRVIFYGEFRELLQRGNDPELLRVFEKIMDQTKHNTQKTVLLGTNIQEPSDVIIKETFDFYSKHGRKPSKNDLVKQHYGVDVSDVNFYLGFDRFSTDGRPILISDKGAEDLYYSVSPHSFLSTTQFRKVLYDHLFLRSVSNAKEYTLTAMDIEMMKIFYQNNSNSIMGVGAVNPHGRYWYPTPQVMVSGGSSNSGGSSSSSVPSLLIHLMGQKAMNNSNTGNDSQMTSPPESPCNISRKNSFNSNSSASQFFNNNSNSASPHVNCHGHSCHSPTKSVSLPGSPRGSPSLGGLSNSPPTNKNLSPSLLNRMQPFLQSS